MKLKLSSLLIAGTLVGAVAVPAQANNDAMLDLLKVLRDKGTISAQDYNLLANAAAADKESLDAIDTKADKAADTGVKITTKGKIKIEDKNGDWSFQPIGRVMWDYIDTDEDDSGAGDVQGTELRRARLGFQGTVYDWGYKFEADFAGGGASIKDAYIKYGTKLGGNKFGLKLGQSHIPFGLTTKISSKYMSFMDRPWFADGAISPARQSGAVVSLADPKYKWTLAAGYTYAGKSSYKGFSDGEATEENGETFAIRGSFVPYMADKKHMVQIGAAYLNLSDDADSFKFEQRLVSHIDNSKHLKGSVSDFDGADAFTVDALGIFGPFHAMAEYVSYDMDSESGNDVEVDGYALEAGYFLTGESLKWKKGYTSGIAPNSSSGAWQIAARFESTEIDDDAAGNDEADKFTIGLNYYPTQNTRLMLNYDKVTDLEINGSSVSFEPSSLKFRAQAYW